MKQTFLFLSILALSTLTWAQTLTQTGLVREQNSGKKPLANVQLSFSGAVPTTSDASGKFTLVFSGKKAGDAVFYKEISKTGYELVNSRDLENIQLANTGGTLGVDIILAKAGSIEEAKKQYYEVSDKALLAGFNREKEALRKQISKAEISQQEYIDRFKQLDEQYLNQKRQLDALAERFAKVNFDDVSEVYKEALELFKAGKVDEAIKKLEDADLLARSERHLAERERIKKAQEIVGTQKEENEKGIEEDIKALLLKASIHLQKGDIKEATRLYDRVVVLAENDLATLLICADFYSQIKAIEKAKEIYQSIIAHPQVSEAQKIQAETNLQKLNP